MLMKHFDLQEYLNDLSFLCGIDSGQGNGIGTEAMADFFEERYRSLGLKTERCHYKDNDFAPVLMVRNSDEEQIDVLFVAHMDTVFAPGVASQWPFLVDCQGVGSGPGCVDCKGGCLSVYYLIRQMLTEGTCNFRFCIILNSDEERGSIYSRPYFEELAPNCKYCFIFEPGRIHGEFVGTRKGGANYLIRCHGIGAHSGVEPEKGASAILELSRWVNELYKLTDYESGTTLNVGRFTGGADNGSVPDYAECTLSFRYLRQEALGQLHQMFDRMRKERFDSRTRIDIETKSVRPAMLPHKATAVLFSQLDAVGKELNQPINLLTTGGGSDGNFISHFGVATLDGCGPCGAELHTRREFLMTESVEPRLDLMYALLKKLYP